MPAPSETVTIAMAISRYLDSVLLARSPNTARTYRNGMNVYGQVLRNHKIDPDQQPVAQITEDSIVWLSTALKDGAPTTERLYLTTATGFFEFLAAENLAAVNLPRVRLLIRQRARRPGVRLPQFPKDAIERILEKVETLSTKPFEGVSERLRNLRDRAFLITLADTGLRVHEACGLRRGDMDWSENRAQVIGKGNRQSVVRFSDRAIKAIKEYLSARATADGGAGRALSALPLFARHDLGAGKKVKPITTATGRNIVEDRVREFLGEDSVGRITPHSFRHYFVTRVLQGTGNLKLAQELARHKNISITQRYAHLADHELDDGYNDVFKEKR